MLLYLSFICLFSSKDTQSAGKANVRIRIQVVINTLWQDKSIQQITTERRRTELLNMQCRLSKITANFNPQDKT